MAELKPKLLAEVLEAVEREEIELTRWPMWNRGARWPGHRAPSLTLWALHRRMWVEAMPTQGGGPCVARVVLTDEGKSELEEVRRGADA